MRLSETITIRRGRAYEIKGKNPDGSLLLRPISAPVKVNEVLEEIFAKAKAAPQVQAPTPTKTVEVKAEPQKRQELATIKYARREAVSASTRMGSCAKRGLRKNAQVRHGFDTNREIKLLANHQKGRNRAKRLGNEGGWVGKSQCWKDNRGTQYR